MRLQKKVMVITGGGSGIGRAAALKAVREGAKVVVADINEDTGKETVSLIENSGGEAAFYKVDVTHFQEVEALVQYAADSYGTIDVMFNNAGIGLNKPFLDHNPEDYDKVVKVNQYGVYYGILAAGRKMKELDVKGSIINTASVFGYMASPGVFGYQAAKGAVIMMTKSAALELAPYGIRVTAVAPGGVNTPIVQGYKDLGLWDHLSSQQMTGNIIEPEQIADVVAFMASEESSVINGTVVMADDGYTSFKSHYGR
ncbi:SDR family oxidoreductase [Bacillus lacus]|uniref:SDR family oxidoreductase n=1 Tax=Metabacillus lacus TaxID=1983721 RepID=A0A7X2IYQ6_9BACI|nr:SDR family oxidoreductase [Metabacillus lacus]MRX71937.1 SDR family oxidoreductase [Metabacillus lacus]